MTAAGGKGGMERWAWIALGALIAAAGVALRSYRITAEPFWLDEAYSAYAASKGWHFLWHVVPLYETHPPFYYSLVRLWSLAFGDGLPALRALGLTASIATVAVIVLAARALGESAGLRHSRLYGVMAAALALAAVSPMLVEMAREVRPYALLILVYAIALLALLRIGRRAAAGGRIGGAPFLLYLTAQALMLWLHNLGPLYALSLGIGLLIVVLRQGMGRRDWAWLIGGHLAVGLVYLPAFLIMIDQAPTWIRSTWLTFSFDTLRERVQQLYTFAGQRGRLAALALTAAAIVALRRSGAGRRAAAMLLVAAILPVALSIAISATVAPVFILRTMTPVAVPALLLMGLGGAALPGLWRWPALFVLVYLIGQLAGIELETRRTGRPMQDWYAAIRWLEPRFQPGDIIYAYPNEGALPFDRAVRDRGLTMPSRPIPTSVPSIDVGGWYPTGSRGVVSLPRDRLRVIAEGGRAVPTIWLLRLGPWAYDKADIFLEELGRDRVRVGAWRSGPIDIVGLRRRDETAPR